MMMKSERARSVIAPADQVLQKKFGETVGQEPVSAQYISTLNGGVIFGVAGLPFPAPVCAALLADDTVCGSISAFAADKKSVLIKKAQGSYSAFAENGGNVEDISGTEEGKKLLSVAAPVIEYATEWGGKLDESGELICDLASPAPGPHYYTNLLIGNRIGFDHPLQSTPKSAIDRIGGGCFRSHGHAGPCHTLGLPAGAERLPGEPSVLSCRERQRDLLFRIREAGFC